MTVSPPATVYCTVNRDEVDDQSEVTWLHGDEGRLAETDDSGKLASDPYASYASDDQRSPKTGGQELSELKLRIARQQEMIDALALKLERCEDENEELMAINDQLVDALALANQNRHGNPKPDRYPSKFNEAPARQPLLEESARLAKDNARLEAAVGVMRSSFHAYVRDSRREHRERKEEVKILLRENQALRRKLSRIPGRRCPAGEESIAGTASTETLEVSEAAEGSRASGPSPARGSSADRVDEEGGGPRRNSVNSVRAYEQIVAHMSRINKKIAMVNEDDASSDRASSADELIVGFGERRGASGNRWRVTL